MHWNFIDLKIKFFRNFRSFVVSPIPKNENSEITEILQKYPNTEIWESSFKNSWDVLQITYISMWFSHIPNQVTVSCFLRASNPSRFIKLNSHLYISVLVLTKSKYWTQKWGFSVISVISFWAQYPNMKTWKSRRFYKKAIILKCENAASKAIEMLFKWHQTRSHSVTLLILTQVFRFFKSFWPF